MLKGGYQIVDLEGRDLRYGSRYNYTNIYNIIKNTNKAILFKGIVISTEHYRDVFCSPILDGDSYIFDVYGYDIIVSKDNEVTVKYKYLNLIHENVNFGSAGEYEISDYAIRMLRKALEGNFFVVSGMYNDSSFFASIVAVYEERIYIDGGNFKAKISFSYDNYIYVETI